MKNFNFILWPAIALTVAVIMYFDHQLQTKPLQSREPIKELTIKQRVELALAIPKSRTTFHDISAKDVPTVKCDSTTTDTFPADEDGPAFVCITYYLGSTEVDLFVE